MSSDFRIVWLSVCSLVVLTLGVSCDSAPTPPVATPPAAPPPPPPPATAATASTANSPSVAAAPSSGEIPAWAGQRPDEPFDVRQFLASRAAPPDNAAPLYLAALAHISSELGGESAKPLQTEIKELANLNNLAAGTVPPQRVANVLTKAATAIQQIDAAQAKPKCVFQTGLSADSDLAHLQAARSFGQLAALQLYHARATGDFALAEAAANRGLRMSRDVQPRGPLVSQLVSISIDGQILTIIESVSLRDPSLTVQNCDRLLAVLAQHQAQGVNRLDEGLRNEYVVTRNSLQDLESGRMTMQELMEMTTGKAAASAPPIARHEAEVAACNRLYKRQIEGLARAANRAASLQEFQTEIARIKSDSEAFKAEVAATPAADRPALRAKAPSFLAIFLTAPIPAFAEGVQRIETQLAGLQMLIALRRYELAHGMLPASLETAAAESSLTMVPTDPYSGQPLKYAVVDGKPTVYSVGKDKQDDGGRVDWNYGRQPGDYLFVLTPSR
jgi:hypothetical protein